MKTPVADSVLDCIRDHGPLTTLEISERLGMTRRHVQTALRRLRARNQPIYVSGTCLPATGGPERIYAYGDCEDAEGAELLRRPFGRPRIVRRLFDLQRQGEFTHWTPLIVQVTGEQQ